MKLIQFWDRPPIPSDVVAWMDGFRDRNPTFDYEFFDEVRAADFIAERQGKRALAAFKAIAVPSMKSDFIRLCALEAWGGVYVDSDQQCRRPLDTLVGQEDRPIVTLFGPFLNGNFLYFPKPHNPFIQACLTVSLDNIESRRFETAFTACGPASYCAVMNIADPTTIEAFQTPTEANALLARWGYLQLLDHARRLIAPTPELIAAWRDIRTISALDLVEWIGGDNEPPEYKSSERHWLNWSGSLYNDVPPPDVSGSLRSMIKRIWPRRP